MIGLTGAKFNHFGLLLVNILSCADLQWPSYEHHEFWMFCPTGRTEEEVGGTCAHITSMLSYSSCTCTGIQKYICDL